MGNRRAFVVSAMEGRVPGSDADGEREDGHRNSGKLVNFIDLCWAAEVVTLVEPVRIKRGGSSRYMAVTCGDKKTFRLRKISFHFSGN